MTSTVSPQWIEAPASLGWAAPMRAVDAWSAQAQDDELALSARLLVRGDDPNLRGHFPGMPVLPGVFVIEALCQVMALACPGPQGRPPALRAVRTLRFFAPFLDGDELLLRARATHSADGGWSVKAQALRHDSLLAARVHAEFEAEGPDV